MLLILNKLTQKSIRQKKRATYKIHTQSQPTLSKRVPYISTTLIPLQNEMFKPNLKTTVHVSKPKNKLVVSDSKLGKRLHECKNRN